MNPPAFLLALAPAAGVVASRSVTVAKNAGESFASMMGQMLGGPQAVEVTPSTVSPPTFAETVQKLAAQLRSWLQENGAGQDYTIDFHVAADGQSQLDVAGESAEQVKQNLESDPSWLDKLRQLAASYQADAAQRIPGAGLDSVAIEIDAQNARIH